MHWTEPADTNDTSAELERRLWATANTLWADADLKPSEYSPIVLGITSEKGVLMASSLVGWLLVAAVSLLGLSMMLGTLGVGPLLGV